MAVTTMETALAERVEVLERQVRQLAELVIWRCIPERQEHPVSDEIEIEWDPTYDWEPDLLENEERLAPFGAWVMRIGGDEQGVAY